MKKLYFLIFALLFSQIGLVSAQYTILHDFNVTNGAYPNGTLTASGKELYGLTASGGANDKGCIFKIDTNGNGYKDMFDFNNTDGNDPIGALTLLGKHLYGMTQYGGANDSGCIFSIDTNGSNFKVIFNFTGANGKWPTGSLTILGNKLFGMAQIGGANMGDIFSIDTNGNGFKDLLNFNATDGAWPNGDLTPVGNILYGMTSLGGSSGLGNIFSIDSSGSNYRDLFDFNGINGEYPYGSLIAIGGKLYGMTYGGGNLSSQGVIFSIDTNGDTFKDLYDFNGIGGEYPAYSYLTLSGNLFYGMVYQGGANGDGVIFSIDTTGNGYKDIFDFNGTNGLSPLGSLTLVNNVLYGMTEFGGTLDSGVIFSLKDTTMINSINEPSASLGEVKLYPNPSNGVFTVEVKSEELRTKSTLEVYNMMGEKVYSTTLNSANTQIDLSGKPAGVYLYRVITESGEPISQEKFIIQ
jgi:uncharacterized repeat protein (TIGR03803 family)